VGFVYPHQKVKVKLVAYPFGKYGMLDGEVINIGPDASERDTQSQSRDVAKDKRAAAAMNYKAVVSLRSQVLTAQGENLELVSGLQVIAEINQGNRIVMEYLLSPVQKTLHDSARER
jgi:HlyD family secretion protein